MAIIDQKIWHAAQVRKNERVENFTGGRASSKPHMLKGLIFCGHGGSSMVIMDRRKDRFRIQCGASREAGTCKVTRRVSLNDLEKTVVDQISKNLSDTAYIAEYVSAYNEARRSHLDRWPSFKIAD